MIIPDIPDGTTKAEAALIYARAGIPVFPCGPDKKPDGRFAPHGYKNATTNEQIVAGWWRRDPEFNIGSPLDEHTLALDVDDTAKALSVTQSLPKTGPVQLTGRATDANPKHHRIFDVNGHDTTGLITVIAALGIETKGLNKGYILLAPSTTEGTYRWVRTGQPEPLPDSLYATLTAKRTNQLVHGDDTPLIVVTGGPCANWCDRTDPISRNPGGYTYLNDFAFHRVTHHRDTQRGVIEDQLLLLLDRMDPPYPGLDGQGVVGKVVDQIMADIASQKIGPDESSSAPSDHNTSHDIGSSTANDLPYGAPPDLLLDPWLHPESTTVMYGPGGVGKGVVSSWLVSRLVAAGHTVMVIDYEYHPREWGNRLDGLQMYPHEKANVHYRAPFGPDWAAKTGTLIEVWDLVREDADALGVTYVVVDSYTPATGDDDRMGGQGAAQNFAQAASRINRPMLVLAHVADAAGRFPNKPFGSVHVRNLVARRQWAVESNGETSPTNPLTEPSTIRLEFRNTKGNDYAKAKPRHVTISFWVTGLIEVVDEVEARASVEFLIDSVLDKPLSIPAIVKAIKEDFPDEEIGEKAVDTTLRRHPAKYRQDRSGKRPYPWMKVDVEGG